MSDYAKIVDYAAKDLLLHGDSAKAIKGTEVGAEFDAIATMSATKADKSGTLAQFAATTSAQLRGVLSDETGTGAAVFATSPTLVTPILGTPTSGTLTNCTGYTGSASQDFTAKKLTISQTEGLVGTTTNNNAQAGSVGECIESIVGVTNAPTSTQWGDLTSISLTAGDWDVTVNAEIGNNGATVTGALIGIGTVTGNDSTGVVIGDTRASMSLPTSSTSGGGSVPSKRISIASTTTYYLKMNATYTVATPQFYGRITARRRR